MAAVGFEEFSAPPGSELALPPLFGGHILESELETEVEFVSGGLGGSGLRERDEEEEAARGQRRRQRELNRRKYQALGRRCREIEQVGERAGPEQAPSGAKDNTETSAGAEETGAERSPCLAQGPTGCSSTWHPGLRLGSSESSGSTGPGPPWLRSWGWAVGYPFPHHQTLRLCPWRALSGHRFLMRVLDTYGDDYRTSQLTIVLEDEGSQGTDAPTPGNAENEPPEKEGLSPPRRTPAPPEPSSPTPAEGPSGRKRRRAPRDGRRAGAVLTPELAPVQIKVEEDFGFEADEALDSSWVSRGPDRLLPYPTLASPPFD
ncbi:TCF3 fusion partner isoform X2 [Mirounga leonina]|nr:TCF3 fusion partner isoform X2 [Mirounga leonina]